MHRSSIYFVPVKASSYAWLLSAGNIAPPGWQHWIAHNFHQKPVIFKIEGGLCVPAYDAVIWAADLLVLLFKQ